MHVAGNDSNGYAQNSKQSLFRFLIIALWLIYREFLVAA